MASLPPDDPLMQPDPLDDDPEVVDSCAPPAWASDSSWQSLDMPAPRSWQDALKRQQVRKDAAVGLSRLARAVQPPLDGLERRSSVQGVDIDLTRAELPLQSPIEAPVVQVADVPVPAVNDEFAPLRPHSPEANSLNPLGQRWLSSLPEDSRPAVTAQRHPHIINKLAVLWVQPKAVETYMNELLLSARPAARRGFAEEVVRELFSLQVLLPRAEQGR